MENIVENTEFTWDLVRGAPKAYFCYKNRIPYQLTTHKGLGALYFFNTDRTETNAFCNAEAPETYEHSRPSWTCQGWQPPPLKAVYSRAAADILPKLGIHINKPLVVINNKYSMEWNVCPFNFFSLGLIDNLISELKDSFQIVYIRPSNDASGYYFDENVILEFDDLDLIRTKHPDTIILSDYQYNFNILQFCMESLADKHITVCGGNACLAAYFGGDLLILDKSPEVLGPQRRPLRGIWQTGSWLKLLSNSAVYGFTDEVSIYKHATQWNKFV